MAEIGVNASGMGIASLGAQIRDSIMRIKGFWDSVKKAPEEIDYMLEDITTLSLVFSKTKSTAAANSNSLSRHLERCNAGLKILQALVQDMNLGIKESKVLGSAKAVLKKKKDGQVRERLTRSQPILMLSY